MTIPRPLVDVLIPGYENLPLTRRLLRSLRQTEGVPCQVIYIDNGSQPYDVGQLLNDHPTMFLVRQQANVGFVRAINYGTAIAMMSPAPYVLWLNNDVEVPAGDTKWLSRLLEPFDNPEVAAVGAVTDHVFGLQRRERAGEDWVDVPILIGFALCVRKSALMALSSPFLDEHFGLGNYEDWDLSLRLREKGGRLIINETVWLKHRMSATFGKINVDLNGLLAKNLSYLIDKWGKERLAEMGIDLQAPPEPEPSATTLYSGGIFTTANGSIAVGDTPNVPLPPLDDYASMMPVIEGWERPQAEFLGGLLFDLLKPQKVIDFGCGPGTYLRPFAAHGCQVLGLDAEPTAPKYLNHSTIQFADLRHALPDLGQYDLGLCIEVAEHLQPEFAETLVANCARSARVIFWSAAHPGQGGTFHYNEREPEYWEELFAARGFKLHPRNDDIRRAIAENAECQKVQWLLPNARLFVRNGDAH